jgi:Tol biopolymer transport system component
MTSSPRFEQDLPMLLDDLYLAGTPDYRDDLVRRIAATRQRPAWTFPERWLPMDIATQAVPTARLPWRQLGALALLTLLLAAAAAIYVGSQPRPPEPFGLAVNGQIAYASDGDVFVLDAPDAAPEVLISGPEIETYVLFSPLGDRLAVFREVEGGEDVWLANADGSDLVRLGGPFAAADWVEWSPDQMYIAIASEAAGIPRIDLVATDGSGGRRVVDIPAMAPSFRPPDGAQLVFRGQEAGRWSFYLVDVAGGEPVRLAIDGAGLAGGDLDLRNPAWSPSGDRLAFDSLVALPASQLGTDGLRIHTASVGPDGEVSDVRMLEFDPRADDELYPTFTPDGTQIVFQQRFGWTPHDPASGIPTTDELFITSADENEPAESLGVLSEPGEGFFVAIAPDGTSLIVHLYAEGQDWLVDPVTRTATPTDYGSTFGVTWQRRGG